MNERYLSKAEMAAFYGVSTRTIDSWVTLGRLPPPERLPNNRPRWLESVARAAVKPAATEAPSAA